MQVHNLFAVVALNNKLCYPCIASAWEGSAQVSMGNNLCLAVQPRGQWQQSASNFSWPPHKWPAHGAAAGVFEALLEEGCVVVATSNRAPWQLNRFGLHEDLFTHFVDKLLQTCDPVELSSQQDYRRLAPGPQARSPSVCRHALLAVWSRPPPGLCTLVAARQASRLAGPA